MLHAVVMAGGAGTRFWPVSRAGMPKQLQPLVHDRTMIQLTIDRLEGLVPAKNTLIVTNNQLVAPMRDQLRELPAGAVIGEPCKRDTAPCIGLAAHWVLRDDPDAIMAVMPADHIIAPAKVFRDALAQAAKLVEASPERIVTFGIAPSYAAEIFGYIERGDAIAAGELSAYQVRRFREKPDAKTAAEYLASGSFYWNSGIFVWKASTILDALERLQPEMAARLNTIAAARDTKDFDEVFAREFAAIQGVSIDYAVMEHFKDIVVIEAPFDWDDVGGWKSLERLRGKDENGNTIVGKHIGIESEGCIVKTSDDHLIVTLGLKDCIVVHTPDATLVASKQAEEQIRRVVAMLSERGWKEFL